MTRGQFKNYLQHAFEYFQPRQNTSFYKNEKRRVYLLGAEYLVLHWTQTKLTIHLLWDREPFCTISYEKPPEYDPADLPEVGCYWGIAALDLFEHLVHKPFRDEMGLQILLEANDDDDDHRILT